MTNILEVVTSEFHTAQSDLDIDTVQRPVLIYFIYKILLIINT